MAISFRAMSNGSYQIFKNATVVTINKFNGNAELKPPNANEDQKFLVSFSNPVVMKIRVFFKFDKDAGDHACRVKSTQSGDKGVWTMGSGCPSDVSFCQRPPNGSKSQLWRIYLRVDN
jgi:hypothetical protein